MNSRQKGARGERQWRDELRENGYAARRGQQFCGSPDSPDVVCDQLRWIHFEVKAVERLNIEDAMEQARTDARGQMSEAGGQPVKVPIVAHKRSHRAWLVTMEASTLFRLLRGDHLNAERGTWNAESEAPGSTPHPALSPIEAERGNGAHGVRRATSDKSISAAACAAATSDKNETRNPNETES